MDILLFDMDGVLLEARGYHRALQETVRLAGKHLSLDDIHLTQGQIHTFESIGISSEWHSSALCMAFLKIQLISGIPSPTLALEALFSAIQAQPMALPASQRSLAAIRTLCKEYGVPAKAIESLIADSQNIAQSPTMQMFQELVLGSEVFQTRYGIPPQFNSQSYLAVYDLPLLTPEHSNRIMSRLDAEDYGAAIMTNRPSSGPAGFAGSPEAEMGMELVHLPEIPLIGYGEISWLANHIKADSGTLNKPHAIHALAAIFSSIGMDKEESLITAVMTPKEWPVEIGEKLQDSSITVFEDTPAGLHSVQQAGRTLRQAGVRVRIDPIGIATDKAKKTALESQGAQIFSDINTALFNLEGFL